MNWTGLFLCAFHSFPTTPRVLQNIKEERSEVVLISPFLSQVTLVHHTGKSNKDRVKNVVSICGPLDSEKRGP